MASTAAAADVNSLLPRLHSVFEVGHRDGKYASSIELCNKVLALDTKQQDALNVLLFCLIQSELYADALKVAARVTNRDTTLERAYATYCNQRFAEAIRIIDDGLGSGNGAHPQQQSLLRLKAQAQYRLGEFAASAASYGTLCDAAREGGAAKDVDLFVNALATFLSGGNLEAVEALRPQLEGLDSSELAFNFGTALLQSESADSVAAAEVGWY